ncbi:MAG: hypothetical protein HYT16_00170 [DPANN group archaeon]|nr:hypothetical protein [DPANN group archaeon]
MAAESVLVLHHKEASELIRKVYDSLNRHTICPRCKRKKEYVRIDFAGNRITAKNICRTCRR